MRIPPHVAVRVAILAVPLIAAGCGRFRRPTFDYVHDVSEVVVPDTIRLGGDFDGALRLADDSSACHVLGIAWTWTMSEARLVGLGARKKVPGCPPPRFRSRIGSVAPVVQPDEPWEPIQYAVVACRAAGDPLRRVIVLLMPQSQRMAKYGGRPYPLASTERVRLVSSDSAKQSDREFCARQGPRRSTSSTRRG